MTAAKKKDPPESDPLGSLPGVAGSVLLSDQIEYYCDRNNLDPPLIENFGKENLKPARYNLRLGHEAHIEGKWVKIDQDHPLILQPHQVAVVRTFEEVNLPKFLIGRWNLTVDMVYEGLLWVGALQVDPGWQGPLPCPIYNLANRVIELRYQQKVFSIDFVRTTPFQGEPRNDYPYISQAYSPKVNAGISVHDNNRLQSAVSATVEKVESTKRSLDVFMTSGLAIVAILFGALAILSTAFIQQNSAIGSSLLATNLPMDLIALIGSLFAIGLSSYAITHEIHPLYIRQKRWIKRFVGFLGIASLAWGIYVLIATHVFWLANVTYQWILNLPWMYGAVHVIVSFFLLRAYRLLTHNAS